MARAKRAAFVEKVSITGNSWHPFGEANWDSAAARYIETGDESLKNYFPTHTTYAERQSKRPNGGK